MSEPTQPGRYEWSGSTLIMTHCIHGLDLRLFPRCYLCRPAPPDPAPLDVELLAEALHGTDEDACQLGWPCPAVLNGTRDEWTPRATAIAAAYARLTGGPDHD